MQLDIREDEVIFDCFFRKANYEKNQDGEVVFPNNVLYLTFKNIKTLETRIEIIDEPKYEFFIVKPEYRHEALHPYVEFPREKLNSYICPANINQREEYMANALGILNEYKKAKYAGWENKKQFAQKYIYNNPYLYQADLSTELFYKVEYHRNYETPREISSLKLSYFDIEVDIDPFPNEDVNQENPKGKIYAISFYDTYHNKLFYYGLKDKSTGFYQSVIDLEENLADFIDNDLFNDYKDNPGLGIIFRFPETEEQLLKEFMFDVHDLKPDFALAWNINFDIKYIMNRSWMYLDLDYNELLSHPDVPKQYRKVNYEEDRKRNPSHPLHGKIVIQQCYDNIEIPGYTIFKCYQAVYANFARKEGSYKLDDISKKILIGRYQSRLKDAKESGASQEEIDMLDVRVGKISLDSLGYTIRNLPYKNYKLGVQYNLSDTYQLFRMESLLNYMLMVMIQGMYCPYKSIFTKTDLILSILIIFQDESNLIPGNVVDYGISETLIGALVADPILVKKTVKPITIGKTKTSIYPYSADNDLTSLYPSIMEALNIVKETVKTKLLSVSDEEGNILATGDEMGELLTTLDTSLFDMSKKIFGTKSFLEYLVEFEKEMGGQ